MTGMRKAPFHKFFDGTDWVTATVDRNVPVFRTRSAVKANAMVVDLNDAALERPSLSAAPAAVAPEAPRCHCATCEPVTADPATHRMVVCERCGDKRCPHAADHRNACAAPAEAPPAGLTRYEAWADYDRERDDYFTQVTTSETGAWVKYADAAARIESDAARIRELEADNANKADHVRILERRIRDLTEEKNCAAIDLAASRERERALEEVLLDIANVSDTDCEEGDGASYIRDLARTAIKRLAAPDSAAEQGGAK